MVKIIAVGHRGTWIEVPENSLISHETAYEMGARGIEFDIRPTKDNVFVIFHDKNLKHKTNGNGKVADKTLAEIKNLRLKHNGQVTEHQIPTLREALRNVQGRFMVDIDFKGGFENSVDVLRTTLREEGFEKDGAPLVTIFCRDKKTCADLMSLNDIHAVRPLYQDKNQARQMSDSNIRVMGLRNHQFTLKRTKRIHDLNMHLFKNTMKYNLIDLARELIGLRVKRKKPKLHKLLGYYENGMTGGALFIQSDYLPDLVAFLKEREVYQDQVFNRNFQPIMPPETDDLLIV